MLLKRRGFDFVFRCTGLRRNKISARAEYSVAFDVHVPFSCKSLPVASGAVHLQYRNIERKRRFLSSKASFGCLR